MSPVITDLPVLPAPGVAADPPHFHECARYQLGDLTRALCRQVVDGETVLLDMPASELDGRDEAPTVDSYLVEPSLSASEEELRALVEDYMAQAALHQRIPMSVPLLGDCFAAPPL